MFITFQSGRLSVSEDGTLRIERVQKSDEGEYSCSAYSSKGTAQASAVVTVRGMKLNYFRHFYVK